MKKTACFALFALLLCAPLVGAANLTKSAVYTQGQFQDVPASAWYAQNVRTAYEYGLMKGVSETRFNPEGRVTLAEAVTMAARLHSEYLGEGAPSGVPGAHWYDSFVDYAHAAGILSRPYDNYERAATRAEFAGLFARALPAEALQAVAQVSLSDIPDVSAGDEYAEAVLALYRAGVLTGTDASGAFYPQSTVSRAESAAIAGRMADETLRVQQQETAKPTGQITGGAASGGTSGSGGGAGQSGTPENGVPREEYATEIVRLVNAARAEEGLSPLTVSAPAQAAAMMRAEEIIAVYGHSRPDGSSCFTALDEKKTSYQAAGENIAYGQLTPDEVVTAWLNSPGHRANIMDTFFTSIGVGVAVSGDTIYWAQFFIG